MTDIKLKTKKGQSETEIINNLPSVFSKKIKDVLDQDYITHVGTIDGDLVIFIRGMGYKAEKLGN